MCSMDTTSARLRKSTSGEMIREADASDARAIAEVHVQSWRESYRGLVPDEALASLSVDANAAGWEGHFQEMTPPECCFVSVDGDGVTGFIHAGPAHSDDLGPHGEVYAIYLLDRVKGQGIGRALMYEAVCRLRAAGFRSVCLWFLKDNPAGGFYQRFGGRVVAEKPYSRPGFTLPSLGCVWDDIEELATSLEKAAPGRSPAAMPGQKL